MLSLQVIIKNLDHKLIMSERSKVLYISQEIAPYLPETPMALAGRYMPQYAEEQGFEVRTFMPKYGCINERRNQLHEVIRLSGMNVIIDDTDHPLIIKVATLQPARMQVYFIDNDDYFHYSPDKTLETVASPDDNDERMMFFARGVIETVRKLRWNPSIVHCMGWISALVPLYLKRMFADDPTFADTKIVYALHSAGFDYTLNPRFREKLLPLQLEAGDLRSLDSDAIDFNALNRVAIDYADAVVEASDDVDVSLIEYVQMSGKPFLPYNGEDEVFKTRYAAFLKDLIAK